MLKMRAFSVTEITKYLKKLIGADPILNQVLVEGEISNFIHHSSNHAYFTLKDNESKINCVMFAAQLEILSRLPQNGDKVHVKGSVSIYERDGRYQLYAHEITYIGMGELYIRYEALKKALSEEGIFSEIHKKKIPLLPKSIGVITSPTGAAIKDIVSVAKRRSNLSDIIIYPVRVQGEFSVDEIVKGIEYFNKIKSVDLILLSRGGGSIEELWSFNEEAVARAIFQSNIPIISGIGHETDYTIADFVSDLRAPTPSAAAEIAIKSRDEIVSELDYLLSSITQRMNSNLKIKMTELEKISPEMLGRKLKNQIENDFIRIEALKEQCEREINKKLTIEKMKLESLGDKLNTLNPLAIIKRGYSIVKQNGEVIKSIRDVSKNDEVEIILDDGTVKAIVSDVKERLNNQ